MNKRATPKYKYQNLKDYLIAKIRSGGLAGSGRLDSEPQLCERFSLSRNTIRQAIQELENEGYVYRIHGKGTFIRNATPVNSRKIALMIYDTAYMAHPVTGGLIRGIDETLSRNGYILDILASKRSFHDENLMRLAESYAGFLIGTYQLDDLMLAELEKISLPHLFVKNYPMNHDVHAARINFTHAGFLAAEHLIRTGCGNLALIYSGDRIAISAEFKEGVYSAALEHGARLRRENIFIADFSDRLAVPEICAELLRHEDRPDGMICASDELAIALLAELKRHGVSVPGDISVIGCNNTENSTLTTPPLSTVDIPVMELGRRSADLLLRMIHGETAQPELLEPSLVIRGSTR